MNSVVIAGVSHKGGTGRSVTLANLAFHLHVHHSANVCLVDLDLASPTLGAILKVKGLEAGIIDGGEVGNPKSTHDILWNREGSIDQAFYDLRTKIDSEIKPFLNPAKNFSLIPGRAGKGDWKHNHEHLMKRLSDFIRKLRSSNYDFILLDIRSGISDVFEALDKDATALIDMLLIHTRWTPQHLSGLQSILESGIVSKLGGDKDKIGIVRTAYMLPKTENARKVDASLQRQLREINWSGGALELNKGNFLGTVPLVERLQWEEVILPPTENKEDSHYATYTSFQVLASKLANKLRG